MYRQIILKSVSIRRRKILIAVFAVFLGTAILTSLLNIYMDLNANMGKELRSFGANIMILPNSGEPVVADGNNSNMNDGRKFINLKKISMEDPDGYFYGYSPYLYGIGKIKMVDVVITGVDFKGVVKISPWWHVNGNLPDKNDEGGSIVGINAAQKLNLKIGDDFSVSMPDTRKDTRDKEVDANSSATQENKHEDSKFVVRGIVKTNSSEDGQIFLNIEAMQKMAGLGDKASFIQVSALTNKRSMEDILDIIRKQNPDIYAKSIPRISKAENTIQNKVQWLILLVVIVALSSSLLCVMSTMMNTIMERTKEIGIMKAIGATRGRIAALFYGEGTLIGLTGGVIGGAAGLLLSQIININVYGSPVGMRLWLIPVSMIIGIIVADVSCYLPVRRALQIDPVITLRGDE